VFGACLFSHNPPWHPQQISLVFLIQSNLDSDGDQVGFLQLFRSSVQPMKAGKEQKNPWISRKAKHSFSFCDQPNSDTRMSASITCLIHGEITNDH
jgi:hypothetical protein